MLESYCSSSQKPIVNALRATIFETGGRAEEVLSLKPIQFEIGEDFVFDVDPDGVTRRNRIRVIYVNGMLVLKLRQRGSRRFPIRGDEPLVDVMLDWAMQRQKQIENGESLPWSDPERFEYLFPYKYNWLYKYVTKDSPMWWPHRLRAEKASQLAVEYGYDVIQLMQWFGWKRMETPLKYARMNVTDLVKEMSRGLI
jgi:hypothetical protein